MQTIIKKLSTFIIWMLLAVAPFAGAASLEDIYATDVPVADNSPNTLQKTLPAAFDQVLVKVSGNAAVMTLPAIEAVIPKINNYVESYSYATQTDAQGKQTLMLHVVFDNKVVKQVLQNAGQAIWGSNRPLTLVWLALPQGGQTTVLASDDNDDLMTTLKQAAMSRGVPVIFPVMDLEDEANVAQITSALPTTDQLQQIAKKYGVNSLLAGNIVNSVEGEWRLVLNGTPYEWQTSGVNTAQVVRNAIDRAADMMVNQLAPVGGKNLENTVTLQISGVQNLHDYVDVVAALKKLTPVAEVTVSDMSNNMLLLKVKMVGGVDELVGALKNTDNFAALAAPATAAPGHVDLFYRWTTAANTN
jgi:hypothetical protein